MLTFKVEPANRGLEDDFRITWFLNGKVVEVEYGSKDYLDYIGYEEDEDETF